VHDAATRPGGSGAARGSRVMFVLRRTRSAPLLPASLLLAVLMSVTVTTGLAGFAGRPELLIADEPTSQLDLETGRQIMRLLLTVVRSEGITALVATHDEALIDLADEVLRLEDGRVLAQEPRGQG